MNPAEFKSVIRYEDQLKAKIQEIQIIILDNQKGSGQLISSHIAEEELKYLQIECSRLPQSIKNTYINSLKYYKRKINEHKQYTYDVYGKRNNYSNDPRFQMQQYTQHNQQLLQNKMDMYDNYEVQMRAANALQSQGAQLQNGFDHHRDIRKAASESEGAINQIQMAILKRKLMFLSLAVFLAIGIIIVVWKKISK